MEGSENRISFVKDIEITNGKADTINSALSNEIENCGGVESLSRLGNDKASVINRHKIVAWNLKRDNPKIISVHCHNYRLAHAIIYSFSSQKRKKKNTLLTKYNNLICYSFIV